MATPTRNATDLLIVSATGGVTVIDPSTPLKRLNYFDGKFLRADDFNLEQGYLRSLVALSNQGGGAGVVYGYDTTLASGDSIQIGPGLAIDPSGKVLLLQSTVTQSVQALIDATRKTAPSPTDASGKTAATGGFSDCVEVAAPPPTAVVPVSDIYVIAICSAEALCGQEDVLGIACQDACVSTTDRPYRLDGIVLRAIPLQLVTPLPSSKTVAIDADLYLRGKVAESWFADEVLKHPNAISRAGLLSHVWCLGAGYDNSCCEVPLAVVARAGATTVFLDAWTVRRERIDAPARRYWQWKMRMRPWDVYLAQILQFQCQLADALASIATPGIRLPLAQLAATKALDEAAQFVAQVKSGLASYRKVTADSTTAGKPALLGLSLTQVSDLHDRLSTLLQTATVAAAPTQRVLISLGLCWLPSGGYLPVVTGSKLSVNDQVRALLGEGLDLRFCITTADYIAHAIEEAQHMDRISLLQGLDDPGAKPHVDILVPDGKALATGGAPGAGLYDAALNFSAQQTGGLAYKGAAREETLATGGTAHYSACAGMSQVAIPKLQAFARAAVKPTAATKPVALTPNLNANAFVKKTATSGVKLDVKVDAAATLARSFISAGTVAAEGATTGLSAARASSATETVDGLWIKARVDQRIGSLGVGDHTPLDLRIVLGTRPATPLAIEAGFGGTLTIATASTASGSLALTGTLNGVFSLGLVQENQAQQSTAEYLVTERFNWATRVRYSGVAGNGSVTLDIDFGAKSGLLFRIAKVIAGNGAQIAYQLALVVPATANAAENVMPLGQYLLGADPEVGDPANLNHRYAESGLDIVQAALVVSDPALKTQAESLLFPAPATTTPELVIQAVRDWVAFVRRRERQCTAAVAPAPVVPPRRYRVIEWTAKTVDDAKSTIAQFEQTMKDPVALAQTLQKLIETNSRDQVHLVVTFAGGSATAQSDLAAAQSDWKTFNPGKDIYYAAAGAAGETDAALQIARIGTFEAAIAAASKPVKGVVQDAIVPYPIDAVPDDADGVMLFVTVAQQAVLRDALLIHAGMDGPNHYFQKDAPNAGMKFADNAPSDNSLHDFIATLTANQPVVGITLATTRAAPDAGATTRLKAVVDALVAAGRPAPQASRQVVQPINAHDRQEVIDAGHDPNAVDEVIFLEPN
jgi:hypothetical protein